MRNRLLALLLGLVLALGAFLFAGTASATTNDYPYEVSVTWQSDNINSLFPQHRVSSDASQCEAAQFQKDLYTIENQADADYLAGLTVLNSPADDAQLSPHGYSVYTVPADSTKCETTTPPPPPVTTPPAPTPSETTSTPPATTTPPAPSTTAPKPAPSTSKPRSSSAVVPPAPTHPNKTTQAPVAKSAPLASTGVDSADMIVIALILGSLGVFTMTIARPQLSAMLGRRLH
jgi:hypothetical protein